MGLQQLTIIATVASIIALLASVILPALQFRILKEFDQRFAPITKAQELEKSDQDLRKTIENLDYNARTELDKEVIKLTNQFREDFSSLRQTMEQNEDKADRRAEELRKQNEELRKVMDSLKDELIRIRSDFELYKKDVAHAMTLNELKFQVATKEKLG